MTAMHYVYLPLSKSCSWVGVVTFEDIWISANYKQVWLWCFSWGTTTHLIAVRALPRRIVDWFSLHVENEFSMHGDQCSSITILVRCNACSVCSCCCLYTSLITFLQNLIHSVYKNFNDSRTGGENEMLWKLDDRYVLVQGPLTYW